MEERLTQLIGSLPIFKEVFPYDSMIAIADEDKFIHYLPGEKMRTESPIGKPIQAGDGLWEAIHQKKIFSSVIAKDVWGFPFKSISTPIFDDNRNVIGALGLAYSLEQQDILHNAAQTVAASCEQVFASSQQIAANSTTLHSKLEDLKLASEMMAKDLNKSDEILAMIKGIVTNTNLLGLNASIEAARAKEYGRGFAIVAQEIRKLSEKSASSLKEIKSIIDDISGQISSVSAGIVMADEISSYQQNEMKDIIQAIESLTNLAGGIQQMASII